MRPRAGRRECFHAVYFRIKHKAGALEHGGEPLKAHEVSFVFDDVLDLLPAKSRTRTMVPHLSTSKLVEFCIREGLVDYVPLLGGRHPVRETCELLMTLGGQYDETVRHRSVFSPCYQGIPGGTKCRAYPIFLQLILPTRFNLPRYDRRDYSHATLLPVSGQSRWLISAASP